MRSYINNPEGNSTVSMYETIQNQYKEIKGTNLFFHAGIDYDSMQRFFVESLKSHYETLYTHYNYIFGKCILDKQRKHFKKYLVHCQLLA
jgi:hypothetical protein